MPLDGANRSRNRSAIAAIVIPLTSLDSIVESAQADGTIACGSRAMRPPFRPATAKNALLPQIAYPGFPNQHLHASAASADAWLSRRRAMGAVADARAFAPC